MRARGSAGGLGRQPLPPRLARVKGWAGGRTPARLFTSRPPGRGAGWKGPNLTGSGRPGGGAGRGVGPRPGGGAVGAGSARAPRTTPAVRQARTALPRTNFDILTHLRVGRFEGSKVGTPPSNLPTFQP